ncbi:hypothetical protein E4T43_02682 [Aureobasidium subglaciale]|nr:hypothetical protein E4T43_02682 [Aureobasidium subglaciale]
MFCEISNGPHRMLSSPDEAGSLTTRSSRLECCLAGESNLCLRSPTRGLHSTCPVMPVYYAPSTALSALVDDIRSTKNLLDTSLYTYARSHYRGSRPEGSPAEGTCQRPRNKMVFHWRPQALIISPKCRAEVCYVDEIYLITFNFARVVDMHSPPRWLHPTFLWSLAGHRISTELHVSAE